MAVSEPQKSLPSPFTTLGLQAHVKPCVAFYVSNRDSDSGPHVCAVVLLPLSHPSRPRDPFSCHFLPCLPHQSSFNQIHTYDPSNCLPTHLAWFNKIFPVIYWPHCDLHLLLTLFSCWKSKACNTLVFLKKRLFCLGLMHTNLALPCSSRILFVVSS